MSAYPPATEPDRSNPAVDPDARPAAPPIPRPEGARDLVPWVTEIVFVAGILVVALVVFLVLTSGANPFATVFIPIIIVLTAIAAVMRHRWISRHRADADFVHSRRAARERRGF